MSSKIDDKSYISIPLLVAICSALIGAAAFITKLNYQTNATAQGLETYKIDTKESLLEIKMDVKEIRAILERRK